MSEGGNGQFGIRATGVVAGNCEAGKGGLGWSEVRANPRSFLRKLSPAPATHFKYNNPLPHPGLPARSDSLLYYIGSL